MHFCSGSEMMYHVQMAALCIVVIVIPQQLPQKQLTQTPSLDRGTYLLSLTFYRT